MLSSASPSINITSYGLLKTSQKSFLRSSNGSLFVPMMSCFHFSPKVRHLAWIVQTPQQSAFDGGHIAFSVLALLSTLVLLAMAGVLVLFYGDTQPNPNDSFATYCYYHISVTE